MYHKIRKKLFGEKPSFEYHGVPPPKSLQKLNIGDSAPNFNLFGVDGKQYSLEKFDQKKAIIVVFSCNHCPFVKIYEDRLIAIQKDYAARGVQLIAINSNDETRYPEESLKNMIIRAQSKKFNFPYLRDKNQSVAEAYGAERTPEVFLFDNDRILRYHGRIDDNVEEPHEVRFHYLRDALDKILTGKEVSTKETAIIGCTIKWKQ